MSREFRLLSIVTRMNVGGPAVQISNLMQGLMGSRVYQVLLTGEVGDDEEDFLKLQGGDLRYRQIHGLRRRISPFADIEALARLSHFIHGFQPHVVHTHTAKAGALGRVAAMVAGSKAKRVHTFHGHLLHGYFSQRRTDQVVTIERNLARWSDRLIAVGETVKLDLLKAGIGRPEQYRVVPPGTRVLEAPQQDSARSDLNLPRDGFVISFVGRLSPIKRIDRLIDAFRIIVSHNPNVRLVVAGDGVDMPLLADARDELGLPIHALGWRSDIERIFAASDVTVLTSDNEGTPVSLIQAGMLGVPAVATNVGSVTDVVRDMKSGLIAEPNPEAIAAAILRLLRDQHLLEDLGHSAREDYRQRFSQETLVKAHLEIYDEILDIS